MTATTDNRELRAIAREMRNRAAWHEGQAVQMHLLCWAERIEALITRTEAGEAATVGAVADEYGWVAGPPHRILSKEESEWFIAETIHGDRVVLKGLPEEYTYDFTTADGTYWKREFIKRWRQFPDSEYKPLGDSSPARTSDARDAARMDWLDKGGTIPVNNYRRVEARGRVIWATGIAKTARAAIDAAMRQEGGE